MSRYKCVACKTHLSSAAGPADLVGDLCPGCGALLEPVGELSDIVGFRPIRSRAGAAAGGTAGTSRTHQRIADRFGDFIARREAFLARARLDARRWIDDEGHFRSQGVSQARPETNS